MLKLLKTFIPGISRVVSNSTPIIILFLFSKFVPAEDLGLLNYFISLITLVGIFTDFGLPDAVQRFLPQSTSKTLIFSTIILESLLVIAGAIIILILDLITSSGISKGYPLILFLIIIFSSSNVIILVFNGLKDKFRTSLYFLLSSLIFLGVTFVLYFFGKFDPIYSFLVGRLISWIIFTIIPVFDLYVRNYLVFKFDLTKRYLRFATNNFIVSFSYNLFNQWDSILIINILGEFQNGIYKSVSFLASLPYVMSVVLHTKFLPEYSELYGEGGILKIRKSFISFTKILFWVGIILVLLSIPLAHLGISIVYNDQIATLGASYFPFILLSVMIYVASVPSYSALQAIGKEGIVRNAALFQGLGFVILSTLFLNSFGLVILPLMLIILNTAFFLVNMYFALKKVR